MSCNAGRFTSGTVIYRKQYIPDYLEQKHKTNYGEVEKIIVMDNGMRIEIEGIIGVEIDKG